PYQLSHLSPESQWLYLLMSFGTAGFLTFLLVILQISRLLLKAHSPQTSWLSKPTATLLLLMLLTAFTAPVFTNHGLPVGLWMLLAMLTALAPSRMLAKP